MKLSKAVDALSALAQESRLSIYLELLKLEEGLHATDISQKTGIPATTLSFHLGLLRKAGLLDTQKEGRNIIYTANKKRAKKLSKVILGKDEQDTGKYQL